MGPLYMCRDFNSRIGDMADYIEGIDSISERHVVYFDINSYGGNLIEFLTDSNCCVVNGRNSICDDFTCIGSTGRSVVDYCITPHETLGPFSVFSVIIITKVMDAVGLTVDKPPDHSIIMWHFDIGYSDEPVTLQESMNL